jgi:hypothetical protein
MALGDFHSRIPSPIVATYPIHGNYNTPGGGMLVLKKIVCKNLQSTVADVGPDRAVVVNLLFGRSAVGYARSPRTPLDVDRR